MINHCLWCCFESCPNIFSLVEDYSTIIARWVTMFGVVATFIIALIALKTYRSNNSIRKWELIKNIYNDFIKDAKLYNFYERIKKGEQINLENEDDKKLMNESLTLFDTLNYFQTQGFLDKRLLNIHWADKQAWEYVACEILNFAFNNNVWKYMNEIQKPYKEKGFHPDIIPFTGFPELLKTLYNNVNKFWVKFPPDLENKFNALSPEDKDSIYKEVADIPDKLDKLKLKDTAAIVYFANKQRQTKTTH